MNKYYLIGLIIALLATLYSCEDIFEDDLNDEEVKLFAPVDNLSTTSTTVTFWWDSIQGATKYKLQVVSETFTDIRTFYVDTLIKKTKFKKVLPVGKYQWRVVAINSSSFATSDTNSFEIRSSKNLIHNFRNK